MSFEWLNRNSRHILHAGYLLEGETPESRIYDIAKEAERRLNIEGFADKFYYYMSKGFFSLSSPVWSNYGHANRGLPISCFGSYCGDSIPDIMYTMSEIGVMSKMGGGTSVNLSPLRPRGAEITNNGKTSGAVHFARLPEQVTDIVSQGCYDDMTEVLTEDGWKYFSDVVNDTELKVAQVDDDNLISFVTPSEYFEYEVEEDLVSFKGDDVDLLVTNNHNMVYISDFNDYQVKRADEIEMGEVSFALSAELPNGKSMTMEEQLDAFLALRGSYTNGTLTIDATDVEVQVQAFLKGLGYRFEVIDNDDSNVTIIEVEEELTIPDSLSEIASVDSVSLEWAEDLINVISSVTRSDHYIEYTSANVADIDFLQALSSMIGFKTKVVTNGSMSTITIETVSTVHTENVVKGKEFYKGTVYCVTVPTHKLIVRRGGRTLVCGNSQRRGRVAPYLSLDHDDAEEFLEIARDGNLIQDVTTGVTVSDSFMESVRRNETPRDKRNRKIWAKTLKVRGEIGFPYVFWDTNANKNKPQVYKDKGMEIGASNLCISGDQRVVTDRGYLTAKELYEQGGELTLFNGTVPVESSEMKLRQKDAEVYKITLSNGLEQKATANHGFPVVQKNGTTQRTELKDLNIGDKIQVQVEKGIFGKRDMQDEAFLLGLYQSDGCQHKDMVFLDVWENDFDILEEIQEKFNSIHYKYDCDTYCVNNQFGKTEGTRTRLPAKFYECSTGQSDVRKKRLGAKTLKKALNFEKGYVPDWIWESNEKTQWEYLRGLLIADGTVNVGVSQDSPVQIAYSDINKSFLKELQILFNNLGLNSSIRLLRKAGESLLPDGKGGHKFYTTSDCWRLVISNKPSAIEVEKNTGFLSRKDVFLEDRVYRDNTKKCFDIVAIEFLGNEDVYCPTVFNDEHIFVSQGLRTFNCSEIALPSSLQESFVCVLSSMNLVKYDGWKDTDAVETLIYFLDTLVSESIEKLEAMRDSGDHEQEMSFFFMKRAHRFLTRHRALGLGTLGYHSMLQDRMIPFASQEARDLNIEMHKLISEKADKASRQMAEEYGEPEVMKGYGRRHTTLTAIAPTKSSSNILGGVSQGIEPIFSNYYIADLAKLKVEVKSEALERVLQKHGKDIPDVWNYINKQDGSVQSLEFLSDYEKEVFKTLQEISPFEIVDHAADRQKYIEQAQSLNIMVHPDMPVKQINALMYHAWERGVISLYYQYNLNASKAFAKSGNDCVSCEA